MITIDEDIMERLDAVEVKVEALRAKVDALTDDDDDPLDRPMTGEYAWRGVGWGRRNRS